ncbi:Uncharacterised protein [uncultured archaeon]|nr:Uncharacterised protein [uncultured archaeon]
MADRNGIKKAFVSAIGALCRAEISAFDQATHEYHSIRIEEPVEIASIQGNISIYGGRPFVHAHVVLANGEGRTMAGHLVGGTIFAAELYMQELLGLNLVRTPDSVTGLNLWTVE